MSIETRLKSLPVDQWRTKQAIVFDWYDGPREGICCLANPGSEFLFDLLDERPTEDGLDDRLFRLSEIAPGSVAKAFSVLHELGSPTDSVWVPVWRFPDDASRRQAEQFLSVVQANARPTSVVISTPDMIHFRGFWIAESSRNGVVDWFSALGISQSLSE